MRSFHAILLAAFLLPCLGTAQGSSDPTPSPSDESSSVPGKVLKAPGHAVGATVHGLGRLIKHKPKTKPSSDQAEPTAQAEPASQPAETGPTTPSSAKEKPADQAKPTSQAEQTGQSEPTAQVEKKEQTKPTSQAEQRGPTAFVQFQGSSSPLGLVLTVVPDVGFQFTRHFGGSVGVPIFFVRSPFPLVTNKDWLWTTIMGSPYVDVHYSATRNGTSFTSILTGVIPVSSSRRSFTTGRAGVDWVNHIEHRFKGLAPFLNLGAANGTVDRYVLPRPYSLARPYYTLGFIADAEGGISYEVQRVCKVGVSAYALVPAGPQRVYSRLVAPGDPVVGSGDYNRYFYSAFETSGPSRIARDNGYSAWFEVTRLRNLSVQVGFTRSVHYNNNSVTLMVNFNGTSLLRTLTAWNRD
jgi:hypothetical protein